MSDWRYIPRKPWHFMKSHEETMLCIRSVLKQQQQKRLHASFTAKVKPPVRRAPELEQFSAEYKGGVIDVSDE